MRLRPMDPSDPAEVQRAFDVTRACDLAVVGATEETLDSTRAQLAAPDVVAVLIGERGDVTEALLVVEVDTHGRDVFIDAYAAGPPAADWYPALVERGLAIAAEHTAADPAPTPPGADPYVVSPDFWQASAAHYSPDVAYADVLARFGFRPVRRFWRMHRPVSAAEVMAPPAPDGVARRTVTGPDDERLLHALYAESFRDHFGFVDRPAEEWLDRVRAQSGVDPGRWWIATLDDDPVALCLLDDSRAEFGEGYVRTLGVVPRARGRGIARWLLGCAVADASARGRSGVALSVDGENATGATELYESVGFTARYVIDVSVRPL